MDHQNSEGTRALHAACATGSPDMVELLVRMGAEVDCRNQIGQTPLIVAAENNQAEIIKHLLEVECLRRNMRGCAKVFAKFCKESSLYMR